MGKRKSSSKPVTKQKVKLDTTFDCLFCNHEKSITVKMYVSNIIDAELGNDKH